MSNGCTMNFIQAFSIFCLIFSAAFNSIDAQDDPSAWPLPLWISKSWQGTGNWTNYTIQLEVQNLSPYPNMNSPRQLYIKYNYLLTDWSGSMRRISMADFEGMTDVMNGTVVIPVDMSQMNVSNQLSLTIYGTLLNPIHLSFVSLALKKAIGAANPAWRAQNGSIVMGMPDELYGPKGEPLTRFNFWLLNGDSTPIIPSTLKNSTDSDLVSALASFGMFTAVYRSKVFFNMADGISLNIRGTVLARDVMKFQNALTAVWQNNSVLAAYGNVSVMVLLSDKCFTEDGMLVSRLTYFVYYGNISSSSDSSGSVSFSVLTKRMINSSTLNPDNFIPYLRQLVNVGGSQYELLPRGNGTVYAAKEAFSLLVMQRPYGNDTWMSLQAQFQPLVRQFMNATDITVKVIAFEETFSEQKMMAYVRIYWYSIRNGTVRDARTHLPFNPPASSFNVTLRDGSPLMIINDDTVFDTQISRSSCFQVVSDTSVTSYMEVQQAIFSALLRKNVNLISSDFKVAVTIVGNEEFVNSSGSSVTVLHFAVKKVFAGFDQIFDADVYPELMLMPSEISLSSTLGIMLIDPVLLMQQSYERYYNVWSFFLAEKPPSFQINMLSANVTAALSAKLSRPVSCTFIRSEEFKTLDGMTIWKVGFVVKQGMSVIYPENIPPLIPTDLTVLTPRGLAYTLITKMTVIRSSLRVTSLFSFDLNLPLPFASIALINRRLTAAFQANFRGKWRQLTARIVGAVEPVICPGCSPSYRMFIQVSSNQWILSAKAFPSLPPSVSTSLFVNITSSKGMQITVIPPTMMPSSIALSQTSAIVVDRPVLAADINAFELALSSSLKMILSSVPGVSTLTVNIVQQAEVKVCDGTTPGCKLLPKPTCRGLGPCSISPTALYFTVSVNAEKINSYVLPMNLISEVYLQSLLPENIRPLYQVVKANVNVRSILDSKQGFTLTFTRPLIRQTVVTVSNIIKAMFQADFGRSAIDVTGDTSLEVVNLTDSSTSSLWQVWFLIVVDGTPLNNMVDKPINVTKFNQLVTQNWTVDWTALNLTDNATVSVDSCLKIYANETVSRLDWDKLSSALTTIYSTTSTSLSVKVVQTPTVISVSGDILTEIRAVIRSGITIINALTLPYIDVTKLTLNLKANNTFVQNAKSLEFYPKSMLYSLALTSQIVDVDILNVSSQLTLIYQSYAGYVGSNVTVKIVQQQEVITISGSTVFLCSFVVLVNGSVQFEPAWVDKTGLITVFPTPTQIATALNNVRITAENSTMTYSSYIATVNLTTFGSYESLLKIYLQQMIAESNFVAVRNIILRFYGFSYPEINFQIVSQEEVVDVDGNFYNMLLILAFKTDGTVVSALDLPDFDWQAIASQFAGLVTPSGVSVTLVTDKVLIGSIRRYKFGCNIYLNQFLARVDIKLMLNMVNSLLPSGLQVIFGVQDRVVDEMGRLSYKVTFFVMRGSKMIDARQFVLLKTTSLILQLSSQLPRYKLAVSANASVKLLSLRRCQKLLFRQFIAKDAVGVFNTQLQLLWARGGFNVSKNFFLEEFVGPNSQTVVALSYFLTQGDKIIDESAVQPPSPSDVTSVVSAVNSASYNYTLFTGTPSTIFSYSGAFKLYISGPLDMNDAKSILNATQKQWTDYFVSTGVANPVVTLTVVGMKKTFGLYSISATELIYKVSLNRKLIVNGPDLAPKFQKSVIQSAASSVFVYPVDEMPMRRDYLYSEIFDVKLTRDSILQKLTNAWRLIPKYSDAVINITGIENRVTLKGEVELTVAVVYYTVFSAGNMLFPADVAAPKSIGLNVLLSSAFQIQWIQLKGGLLSTYYQQKIQLALLQAWQAANPGLDGNLFTIRIIKSKKQQKYYSADLSGYAVRIYFIVLYGGSDFSYNSSIMVPQRSSIDVLLRQYNLFTCPCRAKKSRRLVLRGSLSFILGKKTQIESSLTTIWKQKFSTATVRCRLGQNRRKRDTSTDSTSGNTAVESDVSVIDDQEPDDDGVEGDQPSDTDIASALTSLGLSACTDACTTKCGSAVVTGSVVIDSFEQAIIDAFSDANNLNSSVGIDANASAVDASSGKTCISYCVVSNATELAVPQDNETATALVDIGLTLISSGADCSAYNSTTTTTANNQGMVILITIIPLAVVSAILFIGVLSMFIMSQRTTPPPVPVNLRPPVIRGNTQGLFNQPMRYGTLARGNGLYVTRLQVA